MRGYFAIGIYNPKNSENIGTLWRTAYQLGASYIFMIGKRYKKQASDTCKAFRHIPLIQYNDIYAFKSSIVYDCKIVGIEFNENGNKLEKYKHPKRCIYILGSEDHGFSNEIKTMFHEYVEIPSIRSSSYNVATSGAIVMYDRMIK